MRSVVEVVAGEKEGTLLGTSRQKPTDGLDIVVAATFTSTPVMTFLEQLNHERGFATSIAPAPYGQVVEQLLNPAGAFARNSAGLNVCLIRPADWVQEKSSQSDVHAALGLMTDAAAGFAASHSGYLAVCVFPDQPGTATVGVELDLVNRLLEVPGIAVIRVAEWFHAYEIGDPFDASAAALANVPYTEEAFAAVALGLDRVAAALRTKPRKVIAVDCDFTLWGGASGDLDPAELVIDDRYRAIQQFLREQHDNGFMLVICSRNDPASVDRVFAERADDLVLTAGHFVGRRVNWAAKWENLQSLAAELNVGLDSVILVDDDSLTCAETTEALPSVGVVHLPDNADALAVLRRSTYFDRFFVTTEDRQRNQTYRTDALRAREAASVASPEELNRRLETVTDVVVAEQEHWRRIEQLAARTNQFTCATMTPNQVAAALRGGAVGWVASLRDRFGDYGVVAAALATGRDDTWQIDALMMSCRALNRGVADALLAAVVQAGEGAGFRQTRARIRRTGRNGLAVDFFTRRSTDISTAPDGELTMRIAGPHPAELNGARG